VQFEGQIARIAAEYTQQVSGNSRQSIGFDRYGMDPVTIDPEWIAVYGSNRTLGGGGGLLDIRKMQQRARVLGDSAYIGIGKVYEALVMGMAPIFGAMSRTARLPTPPMKLRRSTRSSRSTATSSLSSTPPLPSTWRRLVSPPGTAAG